MSKDLYNKEIDEKKKKLEELRRKKNTRPPVVPDTPHEPSVNPKAGRTVPIEPPTPSGESADDVLKSVINLVGPSAPTPSSTKEEIKKPVSAAPRAAPKKVSLAAQTQTSVDIQPPPDTKSIVYHQEIQTDPMPESAFESLSAAPSDLHAAVDKLKQEKQQLEKQLQQQQQQQHQSDNKKQAATAAKPLAAADKQKVLDSPEFVRFLSKTSTVIERALSESSYDIFTDYAMDVKEASVKEQGKRLTLKALFKDSHTTDRPVTSLDWSTKFRELMLASYAEKDDVTSSEPDGAVLIWNMHLLQRPEFRLNSQSPVLVAAFHPEHGRLVIGGTETGQVVVWDTREKGRPVNRTSISSGHTHPIYALSVVPSVNGLFNIISTSNDGHLCVWSDNNLHKPSNEVMLKSGKNDTTPTCFDFSPKESGAIVLGSDEGSLYKARVTDQEGVLETVKAHDAPITQVSFHPTQKDYSAADVFLTSSYDWTVKLWHHKSTKALFSFDSAKDYVHDVQWSPVHPSVFVSADGTGRLDVWDVAADVEVPTYSHQTENSSSAVSRLRWSRDGALLASGASDGIVRVYDVDSSLREISSEAVTKFTDFLSRHSVA